LWYSPYVFNVKETSITLVSGLIRFILIVLFTLTISTLLNSLLILDITNLIQFVIWISVGVSSVFIIPCVAKSGRINTISNSFIEVGHSIVITLIVSTVLFLFQ
jgi:hypothetical protein